MTELFCYAADNARLLSRERDRGRIAERLAELDVRYEHIELPPSRLDELSQQDEVIEAYRLALDALMQDGGFTALDVLCVQPDHPDQAGLHREFMTEHEHSGAEGRLFVEGEGLFFMRGGDRVHGLRCQAGDFISLPARISHWFDMGRAPCFRSIRFFARPQGDGSVCGPDMRGVFPSLQACRTLSPSASAGLTRRRTA